MNMERVAVITGGSQGIGRAVMYALLEEGMKVVSLARNQQNLNLVLDSVLPKYKDSVMGIQTDVRNEGEVHNAIEQVMSAHGRIDYLINSAGVSMREKQSLQDTDVEEWRSMIDINLTGTYLMSREVIPRMMERDFGYIINILSTASFRTGAGNSLYCASKYGARALTESMIEENRRSGIRVTAVSPGPVDTTIWNHKKEQITEDNRSTMLKADDIANIITYLIHLPSRVHIDNITVTPWHR
ncbi:SDR family oxidoreductase [Paenibacillus radicis (ex Xue et al. 2023)]|uniref:SDR family oxidoreductase n=1 Tax=Paenibacillus radicis (ex Xue et al. 2023) TaxID=2972489 RepID=A0ABT1YIR0_9BACL|nr:SDR family oxidoreductase [Paenibacillus radicis (ex Xue et al. 2023)]MCR8633055.1 SDR family oxidoreductase [Paenibacillus radicis (ex Xue et al. 2023)]